ncbi:MAG: hypothetical protein LQ340_007869, partial [Diploschistes diacapsis]
MRFLANTSVLAVAIVAAVPNAKRQYTGVDIENYSLPFELQSNNSSLRSRNNRAWQ